MAPGSRWQALNVRCALMIPLHRLTMQALIVASAMTLCVFACGPVVPLFSIILLLVGFGARITGWIQSSGHAVAVLGIGFILYHFLLWGALLIFGSGPPQLLSCIGFSVVTSGVTVVFLWVPLGLGLLLGRWCAPSRNPIEPTEAGMTKDAAVIVRREAINRLRLKEDQFEQSLVERLKFAPAEVIGFIDDLESDYGFDISTNVSISRASISDIINATACTTTEEAEQAADGKTPKAPQPPH